MSEPEWERHELEFARRTLGIKGWGGKPEHIKKVMKDHNLTEEEFRAEAEWFLYYGFGICG